MDCYDTPVGAVVPLRHGPERGGNGCDDWGAKPSSAELGRVQHARHASVTYCRSRGAKDKVPETDVRDTTPYLSAALHGVATARCCTRLRARLRSRLQCCTARSARWSA